jgi:molybdopterin converting factor small subunit
MRVRVLYFGVLREKMGRSDEAIELQDEATAGDLLRVLRGRTSKASMANGANAGVGGAAEAAGSGCEPDSEPRLWQSLAVAVNREYGSAETVLRGGDEVALLPPVSGGSFGAARTDPMRTAKSELRPQRLLMRGRRNED